VDTLTEAQLQAFIDRVIRRYIAGGQQVDQAPLNATMYACNFLLSRLPLTDHREAISVLQVVLRNREAHERRHSYTS
jgi:hypothetical protein